MSWKGNKLKDAREGMGLSQAEFAFEVGKKINRAVSMQNESHWESGVVPGAEFFCGICQVTGKEQGYFFDQDSEEALTHDQESAA